MTQRIITFGDTETTGLNLPDERIIECCLIQYDLDTEAHLKTWVWRSNPLCKIGPKAFKVHGIRLEDLAAEPTWDIVAPAIRGVIEPSYAFVAHNGHHFDFDFIQRECTRVGQRINMPILFDTMTEARWATGNGKMPKLGELAACLDVSYDPALAHGAAYDTTILAQAFFEARRLGWYRL